MLGEVKIYAYHWPDGRLWLVGWLRLWRNRSIEFPFRVFILLRRKIRFRAPPVAFTGVISLFATAEAPPLRIGSLVAFCARFCAHFQLLALGENRRECCPPTS